MTSHRSAVVTMFLLAALTTVGCTRNSDSTPIPTETQPPTRSVPLQPPVDPFDLVATVFADPQGTGAPSLGTDAATWRRIELPGEILPDAAIAPIGDGKVLVFGGALPASHPDAWVVDPETGDLIRAFDLSGWILDTQTEQVTSAGEMVFHQQSQLTYAIGDGRVVGFSRTDFTRSQMFDPATKTWSAGPELNLEEIDPFLAYAALAPDGSVDAVAPQIPDIGGPHSNAGFGHSTILFGGRLLMLDEDSDGASGTLIFDPQTEAWDEIVGPDTEGRPFGSQRMFWHTLLTAVGNVHAATRGKSYMFDTPSETWTETSPPPERYWPFDALGLLPTGETAWKANLDEFGFGILLYSPDDDKWQWIDGPMEDSFSGLAGAVAHDGSIALFDWPKTEGVTGEATGEVIAWVIDDPLAAAVPLVPHPEPVSTPTPFPSGWASLTARYHTLLIPDGILARWPSPYSTSAMRYVAE